MKLPEESIYRSIFRWRIRGWGSVFGKFILASLVCCKNQFRFTVFLLFSSFDGRRTERWNRHCGYAYVTYLYFMCSIFASKIAVALELAKCRHRALPRSTLAPLLVSFYGIFCTAHYSAPGDLLAISHRFIHATHSLSLFPLRFLHMRNAQVFATAAAAAAAAEQLR